MKKLPLALFLCAVTLFTVSCGDTAVKPTEGTQNIPTADTTVTDETETEDPYAVPAPNIPEKDYGGDEFLFLNSNVATWMMTNVVTAEAETGDAINDAIYRRNRATEEKYNVKIAELVDSQGASIAQKAITAGDDSYDVIILNKVDSLSLVIKGCALEYSSIPYLDMTAPWWVQSAFTDMSIANKVYFGVSTFDTSHYDSVRTLFFNKTMVQTYDLANPYQLVADNKWTLENFKSMALSVAQDLDGDGAWTAVDQYGYTSWSSVGGQALMTGVGAPLTLSKDADDMPYFNMNNNYYIERLDAIADLYATKGFKNPGGDSSNHGGLEYFMAGTVLFYSECMGNAQSLRQMTIDFGILPSPKYDEAQENYANVGGSPEFFIFPITSSDLERSGIIMESLSYESMTTVKRAAYDEMLWGKISRDNDSEGMLDIIFSTLKYDHPTAITYVNGNITDKYLWNGKKDFASYFTKSEAKIQKEIDKTVDAYTSANN